ncbi:MAG: FAD-dependent monooxygenase [Rhodospirillaceae bacterium]|nr:FAD-dependent monooxygenase [Rhodospirillaceae bacterium]
MSRQTSSFLIVGAGIGGLALGIGLKRLGHAVKIVEAAPRLVEIGAGISISPNAAHALTYLGLGGFLESRADTPSRTAIVHYKTGMVLRAASIGDDFVERYGAKYYQIHRADLHEGLVNALTSLDPGGIAVGHAVTGLRQTDTGVDVTCKDGTTFRADFVIGCDGLRSTVRAACFATTAPRWTGQVAYRATLDAARVRPYLSAGPTAVTVGPAHMVTRYLMRHGRMVNLVAIAQSEAWKEEGWSHPATVAELLAEHEGWNADILGLIEAAPPDSLFKWALFDRDPLDTWVNGRVALLGDAAHPMLPFLGMGAAMALEDAVVLTRCVENFGTTGAALTAYQATRLERANATVLASRAQGQLLQNADPDAQNWGAKPSIDNEEWRRYGYNPATIELAPGARP